MPVPNVSVTKNPFALPSQPPSADGVLAIIASSELGVPGSIGAFGNPNVLLQSKGYGPLSEYGAYNMSVSGKPVIAVSPPSITITGTYGAVAHAGVLGTCVPTAGTTHPLEHYFATVTIVNGGTVGTAGITYTYSLDGVTTSAPQSLGTATTLTIPHSGVSFALGAGTLLAGDTWNCFTERALLNDADVVAALTALGLTRLPWEMVLIDSQVDGSSLGAIDTILAGWEANGQFKIALLNTRFKNEPQPTGETEGAYATAMQTLVGSQTSERICVGADGGHLPSALTAFNLKRPTSLALAARAMSLVPNIGVDPAFVGTGPLAGFTISDANSNPFDHDEALYPDLDNLQLVTLRSFAPGGPAGVYINNANVLSGPTSNFRYLQHLRVLNKACSITWAILTTQLSLGVRTQVNSTSGALNIAEIDGQKIEQLVNPTLQATLKSQVTGVQFTLSRDDNLQANPPIVTGQVSVASLVYVKGFAITVALVKQISASG
jgi:hypothetical protein